MSEASRGYGVPLGPGVHFIGSYRVVVERESGGLLRYRGPGGSSLVADDLDLIAVPMYPVMKPAFVTRMILAVFREPIIVGPEETISFYFKLPVDVAIYATAGEGSSFQVVDVLELSGEARLALYGPLHSGVVARKVVVDIELSEPRPSIGYAVSKVVFKNAGRGVVRVSKLLLDASPLKIYYRRGSWEAYTQEVIVSGSQEASIVVYGEPFKDGMVELPDPPELRPPRLFSRTDMSWGV